MEREIIFQQTPEMTIAALIEDTLLVEYYLEAPQQSEPMTGSIYKGRIERVLPGMQAAFVDIGTDKNAFLYVADAVPEGRDPALALDIGSILKAGQEVVVQVVKSGRGDKGPRVTCKLTLPGHYGVLVPNVPDIGVSRKIADETVRERLRAMAEAVRGDSPHGLVVRTNAQEADARTLTADFQQLNELWRTVSQRIAQARQPGLVYGSGGLVERILRDACTVDVTQVLVNSEGLYWRLKDQLPCPVRLKSDDALESLYGLQPAVEQALRRRVWLKNGGYLVIDETEALVSIDVNTGKYVGRRDFQDTFLEMNIQAAAEIARQIRLRNLGGIIVVDFIDMTTEASRQQVMEVLCAQLRRDRLKTTVLGFTSLGLLEMTRQKSGRPLSAVLEKPCPFCQGKGRLTAEETIANGIIRQVRQMAALSDAAGFVIQCHPQTAAAISGEYDQQLRLLGLELSRTLEVRADSHLSYSQWRISRLNR